MLIIFHSLHTVCSKTMCDLHFLIEKASAQLLCQKLKGVSLMKSAIKTPYPVAQMLILNFIVENWAGRLFALCSRIWKVNRMIFCRSMISCYHCRGWKEYGWDVADVHSLAWTSSQLPVIADCTHSRYMFVLSRINEGIIISCIFSVIYI